MPAGVGILTAAVDVQGDRLELLVRGWGAGQESWDIAHFRLWGDPEDIATWRKLDRLWMRPFQHELGAQLFAQSIAIDSGDYADQVYTYVKARRARGVLAIKGVPRRDAQPLLVRTGRSKKAGRLKIHLVTGDVGKDITFKRLQIAAPGPGYIHFPPPQADGLDDEYLRQFLNDLPSWRKQRNGRLIKEYRQKGAIEAVDLHVYNLAALHILGTAVTGSLPLLVAQARAQGEASRLPIVLGSGTNGSLPRARVRRVRSNGVE